MGHHRRVALGRADIGGRASAQEPRASHLRTGAGWDDHRARRGGRIQGQHPLEPSLDVANVEADLTIVTAGVATRSDCQDGRRECSQSSPSHLVTSEATSTPWAGGSLSMDGRPSDSSVGLSPRRTRAHGRRPGDCDSRARHRRRGHGDAAPRPVRRAADRQPGVWPFKPEVGATRALGSWTLDGAVHPQRCVLPRASGKDGSAAILVAGMMGPLQLTQLLREHLLRDTGDRAF
jgi:hypothetical protein